MGSSGDRLCQTSPIPRSPDGDNKQIIYTAASWIGLDANGPVLHLAYQDHLL